jgi:iron-sulfur cluster assembly accessory protein
MVNSTETEAVVTLTESAVQQVKALLAAEAEPVGKCLRIRVEGGGCSGKKYGLLFDQKQPDDVVIGYPGASVIVDPASVPLLRGMVVDYLDDINSTGFKIFNPNARESCGCGKSFAA